MKALNTISIATLHALATTALLHAQGPLDPPGPPAPSMKTAQEIFDEAEAAKTAAQSALDPRTPLSSLPIFISQPGSYYLTNSLVDHAVGSGEAINITSDNVTLDFNGFTLSRGNSVGPTMGTGIYLAGGGGFPKRDVVIKNGSIQDFNVSILVTGAENCKIINMHCSTESTNPALQIRGESSRAHSKGVSISNCAVYAPAASAGIKIQADTASCSSCSISNCNVIAKTTGILLEQVGSEDCLGHTIEGNSISVTSGIGRGVDIDTAESNLIRNNHLTALPGAGTSIGIRSTGANNKIVTNVANGFSSDFELSGTDVARLNNYQSPIQDGRIAITTIPFTIDQPGSYYLTSNLVSTSNGITIDADDVTIDLSGFTLIGTDNEFGIGDTAVTGVLVNGSTSNLRTAVCVKNGTIRGFSTCVELNNTNGGRIENLKMRDSALYGLLITTDGAGQCDGNSITKCSVTDTLIGILLDGDNGGTCTGNIVTQCTIGRCVVSGVEIKNGDGNQIKRCTISKSGASGIALDGSGSVISSNTITVVEYDGIKIKSGGTGNRIENNQVSKAEGAGFDSTDSSGGNLFLRNSAWDCWDNFDLNTADIYGPEVTATGALSNTGDQSHPWANFSHTSGL